MQYVLDNNDVRIDQGAIDDTIRTIYKPFNTYGEHQHETSRPELNANYLLPKMALHAAAEDHGRVRRPARATTT